MTGASGFIGKALCPVLDQGGWRVRALVRSEGSGCVAAETLYVRDLADRLTMRAAFEGVDAVVHLAARVHVMRERDASPLEAYRRVNVECTRSIVEAAEDARVPFLVFASSVKAVGEGTSERWNAATLPAPTDPYGVSKLEAEDLVRRAAHRGALRAVVLRFPLVYGPGMTANMLRLFGLVDRRIPIPLAGGGGRRSLVFVGNAVAAIRATLDRPSLSGTYFVSDGEDLTIGELVTRIGETLGKPARLLRIPARLLQLVARAGDFVGRAMPFPVNTAVVGRLIRPLIVDSSDFNAAAGLVPPYSVSQGLALTAEWYRRSVHARG